MPTVISPVRFMRAARAAITGLTAESDELDFQLAVNQGVKLLVVRFGVQTIDCGANDEVSAFQQALHVETGALETIGVTDTHIDNSEIIARAVHMVNKDGTQGAVSISHQNLEHDFTKLPGGGLLLAQNITYQVAGSSANVAVADLYVDITYQYVTLTAQELAQQFILRR